jgi:amino acid transporter
LTLSFKDISAAVATRQAFGFPIADTIKDNLTFSIGGITMGDIYLVVILVAVYVCTLAIQGATTRLMFSMGRDRRLPLGGTWGHVHPTLKTPANAAVAVGVLAASPLFVTGAGSAAILAIGATGMIYLAYFMCNLGVMQALAQPSRSEDIA